MVLTPEGVRTECRETQQTNATWVAAVYRQSVAMLADQKWDAVKLDGCSQFHNTSLWANLMEETGRPIAIENCNNEVRHMPWLAFVREISVFDCQLNLMLEPRHTAPARSGSKSRLGRSRWAVSV
jgi:hypothetical protein